MTLTQLLLRRVFNSAAIGGGVTRSGSVISTTLLSSSSSSGCSVTTATAAALVASTTAAAACFHHANEETNIVKKQTTFCDTDARTETAGSARYRFKGGRLRGGDGADDVILRKRMTSIGRFSMKSETPTNPSIPTFFLALANNNKNNGTGGREVGGLSVPELETLWIQRDMHNRHPRFHSRVSKEDDRYFEQPHHPPATSTFLEEKKDGDEKTEEEEILEVKAEVHNHAIETLHPSTVYRDELRKRIEDFLTKPLDIMDKLWEVELSTGPLGSSGAIGRAKADQIRLEKQKGKKEKHNSYLDEPTESILLFRAHHALADGVSLAASLADLSDEAEELRQEVENEIQRRKNKRKQDYKELTMLQRWLKLLRRIIWFCLGSLRAILYQLYVTLATVGGEPFENVRIMYEEEERKSGKYKVIGQRSISWCDAASVEEVKFVAKSIGKNITLNDVFVSCASSAIARQLAEHRQLFTTRSKYKDGPLTHKHHPMINVVMPVHLGGGVLLPGKSVGNNIGAMVARIPGEINNENDDDTSDSSIDTAVRRLKSVHTSIYNVKNTPAPLISYVCAKFCSDILPESITKRIFQNAHANAAFVLTNNRGPPKKLHMHGRPVEAINAFFPLPPGMPVGIVVQSYAGVVSISVTAEKWAIPDADKFLGWMLEEYGRLYDEVSKIEKDKKKRGNRAE